MINVSIVFADELEWKSGFDVGFLPNEEDLVNLQVLTFSNESLQLEWQKPENSKIMGYKILRKSVNSDYVIVVENTFSTSTKFLDEQLPPGYYGYKIVPIEEKSSPDTIQSHGIDRNSNLFSTYKLGQELLAINSLNQTCNKCLDEPFRELRNIKSYIFNGNLERSENHVLQQSIENELIKSQKLFENLFKFKINH